MSKVFEHSKLQRLKDKVAIVTGSSSGIGAVVARAYGREGARVVINHLGEADAARRVVEEIRAEGTEAIVIEADISKAYEVKSMVDEVHSRFGLVDILVNNAGIYPRDEWEKMTESQWDRVLDVNLKGCFICAKAVCEDMQKSGYGKIINVSSIAGLRGMSLVHYATSKTGVIGFTRGLALSLGKYNICVNAILPGAIKVERVKELDSEEEIKQNDKNMIEAQCIKRRGTPLDTTGAFVFFASHESDWISGHCLTVDGGYTRY